MRNKLAWFGLVTFLLVGCDNNDHFDPTTAIEPKIEGQATPTLIPGLPTNTPAGFNAGQANQTASHIQETPTIPRPATATPFPEQRLILGQNSLENENYSEAKEEFATGIRSGELTSQQNQEALFQLGQAQLGLGDDAGAVESFSAFLSVSETNDPISNGTPEADSLELERSVAYFFLGQALAKQGDCQGAIEAYSSYSAANPDMNAYIQPRIAECYLELGNRSDAVQAYELAAAAESDISTNVHNQFQLARAYFEGGDYQRAIAQYDAILDIAQTDNTRAEALYQAGTVEMSAGNQDAAYQRFLEGVNTAPTAYESYLGLVALIEAGVPVDDFQRGVVDFHAKAYEAAIAVLAEYIEENETHREDAHLFLAWSFEALSNLPAALDHIDAYIEATDPGIDYDHVSPEAETTPDPDQENNINLAARGWLEKGKMLARAGLIEEAIASYRTYIERFPEGEDAPFASWWAAAFTEDLGDIEEAIALYADLAANYPFHEDAAEALYRAGLLTLQQGRAEDAIAYWRQAVDLYPDQRYGFASLLSLLQTLPEDEMSPYTELATHPMSEDYYAIRAKDLISETVPFAKSGSINLLISSQEKDVAEDWLRDRLGLEATEDVSQLPFELTQDGRLIRGQKLWEIGLKTDAKRELEILRSQYVDDPLNSYRLALFFQELGLFRSSILSATSVMNVLEVSVFDSPHFIGTLAYPVYYADLVLAEAEKYELDPLLQFALIRQESLFESFATSSATAQGLSQVIPDTGAYIAQRLSWPNYTNEDLYKPYVGIVFGAYYLAQQIDAFGGDVAAALSAYNGGPGNAARWYGDGNLSLDEYIETVDFSETRQYIQRIYSGHAVYKYLYELQP